MNPFALTRRVVFVMVVTLLFMAVSPVHAADAVVGDGTPASCTQTTYNAAVIAANDSGSGTVTFNCGANPHTIPLNSYIFITGAVTIDGGGLITLDGTDTTSFYQTDTGGELHLRNINYQNGRFNGVSPLENFGIMTLNNVEVARSANFGTAVANYGAMTVENSDFRNNTGNATTTPAGGAIRNEGGTLAIRNSNFYANQIGGRGGAIANEAGTMTIDATRFELNSAFDGGGIYITGPATATITASTFINNSADYGAAIEMGGSAGQLDIVRSTFSMNSASNDGGAIWVLSGDADIDSSTFDQNISGTTGGAISCYGDTVSIINSTLSANHTEGTGGGIYSTCNLNITNLTASENRANGGGGAIYHTGAGFASINYATIVGNTAAFGAGLYNDNAGGAVIDIKNSLLSTNVTGNCDGVITSSGYNFSSDGNCGTFTETGDQQNVALAVRPLGNYGGLTQTRPPLTGNPVIDAIPQASCGFSVDQRGIARPQNSNCDSGAVEFTANPFHIFIPIVKRAP